MRMYLVTEYTSILPRPFILLTGDILLQKLKDLYNIDGTLLKLLSNYLSNKNQKVVIGSESSSVLNTRGAGKS